MGSLSFKREPFPYNMSRNFETVDAFHSFKKKNNGTRIMCQALTILGAGDTSVHKAQHLL